MDTVTDYITDGEGVRPVALASIEGGVSYPWSCGYRLDGRPCTHRTSESAREHRREIWAENKAVVRRLERDGAGS